MEAGGRKIRAVFEGNNRGTKRPDTNPLPKARNVRRVKLLPVLITFLLTKVLTIHFRKVVSSSKSPPSGQSFPHHIPGKIRWLRNKSSNPERETNTVKDGEVEKAAKNPLKMAIGSK